MSSAGFEIGKGAPPILHRWRGRLLGRLICFFPLLTRLLYLVSVVSTVVLVSSLSFLSSAALDSSAAPTAGCSACCSSLQCQKQSFASSAPPPSCLRPLNLLLLLLARRT